MANWVGHIVCKNRLLEHIIERMVERRTEVMGRRGRRRKHILDDRRVDHAIWRTHSGRGCRSVVRQTME